MLRTDLDEIEEAPCARCRKVTPAEAMQLWTTRERVRTLARAHAPAPAREPALPADAPQAPDPPAAAADPTFRYATSTRVDAVCPECWGRLTRGAPLDGPERLRVLATVAIFLAIAAFITWGIPTFMPNLLAAFWRNGAGGR